MEIKGTGKDVMLSTLVSTPLKTHTCTELQIREKKPIYLFTMPACEEQDITKIEKRYRKNVEPNERRL